MKKVKKIPNCCSYNSPGFTYSQPFQTDAQMVLDLKLSYEHPPNPRYFHELLSAGNKIFIQKEILYLNILDAMLITPRLHVVFYNYNLLERVRYLDIPWDRDIDLVQALAREVIIYSYADQANDSIFFKLESFDKIIRRFFSSTEYPVFS